MTCPLIPRFAMAGKADRQWLHNHPAGLRQSGIEPFPDCTTCHVPQN